MTYSLSFQGTHRHRAADVLSHMTSITIASTTTHATSSALSTLAADALDLALLAGPGAIVGHLIDDGENLTAEICGGDPVRHIRSDAPREVRYSLRRLPDDHRDMLWLQTLLSLENVPRFQNPAGRQRILASVGIIVVREVMKDLQQSGQAVEATAEDTVSVVIQECPECAAPHPHGAPPSADAAAELERTVARVRKEWARPDVRAAVDGIDADILAELVELARRTLVDAIEVEGRGACLLEFHVNGRAITAGYTSKTLQHFQDNIETFTVVPVDMSLTARLIHATAGDPCIANVLWLKALHTVARELIAENFASREDIDYVLDGAAMFIALSQNEGAGWKTRSA